MIWRAPRPAAVLCAIAVLVAGARGAAQPASETHPAPAPSASEALPAASQELPAASATSASAAGTPAGLRALYEQSARSVVRIQTDEGTGSGFFFHSPRHVGTAFHVVLDADYILVETEGGDRILAEIAAFDEAHDVALLELDVPVPGASILHPYEAEPFVGMDLAVIGHPFSNLSEHVPQLRGLLNWSLTRGVVGALSRSWLQTDAAVNPGSSGGPALAPDGSVVGLVSAKLSDAQGIGLIARVERLLELRDRLGSQIPPRPLLSWDAFELGFAVDWGDGPLLGFAVGGGGFIRKRFPIRFRFAFVAGQVPSPTPDVLRRELERFALEVESGYELHRGPAFDLAMTAGLALHLDDYEDLRFDVASSTNCGQAQCPLEGRARRETQRDLRALPMLGASIDLWMLRIAYAYQFDVVDFGASQHRAIFGVAF